MEIGDVVSIEKSNEKSIWIKVSNGEIRLIKTSVEFYKGDKDDTRSEEKMEKIRDGMHQAWKLLNPS